MIPSFAAVLAAQAMLGIGGSLRDGADSAWIADELGVDHAGPVYLRATQIGWFATLPGIAISAALGSIHLNLPVVLGGGLFLALAGLLAAIMPERQFRPASECSRTSLQEMTHTMRVGMSLVRHQPALRIIVASAALCAVFGAGFHRLWQYHILHHMTFPTFGHFAPIVWFGCIEALISLTSAFGIELVLRRTDTNNHSAVAWALCITNGITFIGALGFALTGHFALALAALWLVTTAMGPHNPLEHAWINQSVVAGVRATVFSVHSQVQDLAGIVGGPLLGAIATGYGTPLAISLAALFLAPTLLLYARSARSNPDVIVRTSAQVIE